MEDEKVSILRRNKFYNDCDLPALGLINRSKTLTGAIFWYIIFIAFGTICIISLIHQFREFYNSPTQTEVANVRATSLKLPNISLCLTGWPNLPTKNLWSPVIESTADAPTWVYHLVPYVELELQLAVDANGTDAIWTTDWQYFVWMYVDEYVRSLLKIELHGAPIQPWWHDLEANIWKLFRPYTNSMDKLISKYANETLRMSGCLKDWPKEVAYTVSPFVDSREVNERCMYITHTMEISQKLSNQLKTDAVLQSCNKMNFTGLLTTAIMRARTLASFTDKYSEGVALFGDNTVYQATQQSFYTKKFWCTNTLSFDDVESTGLCAKCQDDAFACGDGTCIPAEFKCDGDIDCENTGRDEEGCKVTTIVNSTDALHCCGGGNDLCAPETRCNGIVDCRETWADEMNCVNKCTGFDCGDGQCIPSKFRCDGLVFSAIGGHYGENFDHCYNGADEKNCAANTLLYLNDTITPAFDCGDGVKLIETDRVCDSFSSCKNGIDEHNCEIMSYPPYCNSTNFAPCGDRFSTCYRVLPLEFSSRCDSVFDCPNKRDEKGCTECNEGLHTCDRVNKYNFTCYRPEDICDTIEDCDDGSDEVNCTRAVMHTDEARQCTDGQFRCSEYQCIDKAYLCNGITDCFNRRDESSEMCRDRVNFMSDNVCDAILHILPVRCGLYDSGLTPASHNDSCIQHRLPWRQRAHFVALANMTNSKILCNGKSECTNGVDELAYICGHLQFVSDTAQTEMYMNLAQNPWCHMNNESRVNAITNGSRYYYRELPISLTDCIEACMYLSNDTAHHIDLGLPFVYYNPSTWSGACTGLMYDFSTSVCQLIAPCNRFDNAYFKSQCGAHPLNKTACAYGTHRLYYEKIIGLPDALTMVDVRQAGYELTTAFGIDDEQETGIRNAIYSCMHMPRGTVMANRCELWHIMHTYRQSFVTDDKQMLVKLTVDAPTSSPLFYNLPTITSIVGNNYEARLSVASHFILMNDCNVDNVSTRQCQLHCRRRYLHSRCNMCVARTLSTKLLGLSSDDETGNVSACMMADYAKCYNTATFDSALEDDNNVEMKNCLSACQPGCDYWVYELTHTNGGTTGKKGEVLIVPLNDYVEFTQKYAYTWHKVVADFGGLLEFWIGAGLISFLHIALYFGNKAKTWVFRRRFAVLTAKMHVNNKMFELAGIQNTNGTKNGAAIQIDTTPQSDEKYWQLKEEIACLQSDMAKMQALSNEVQLLRAAMTKMQSERQESLPTQPGKNDKVSD